ncbi:hypothetical protein QQ045_033024 [Rhodiola kirilowii]
MAMSSILKHRPKQTEPTFSTPPPSRQPINPTFSTPPPSRQPIKPTPQPGLKSLALSILLPLTLTALSIFFFGSKPKPYTSIYFPPLWLIHIAKFAKMRVGEMREGGLAVLFSVVFKLIAALFLSVVFSRASRCLVFSVFSACWSGGVRVALVFCRCGPSVVWLLSLEVAVMESCFLFSWCA